MASSDMTPLRVRAWLRTPVIADQWLPLDGALLATATRRDLGSQILSLAGESLLARPHGEAMRGGKLPITTVHARDWYYRCSWAQWGPHVDGLDAWSKRFDATLAYMVDFRGRRGRVDTSAGAYKGYRMPVYYRAALWVEWYCVGSEDAVSDIAKMITHLGKKTDQGWGRVMRWDIETIQEDWSIWRDGRLMRGIPIYHWPRRMGTPVIGIYGIRPSYWDKRNQVELVMP